MKNFSLRATTYALLLILGIVILFDYYAAATLYPLVLVISIALGLIFGFVGWKSTQDKAYLTLAALFVILVILVRLVSLNPIKPFKKLYLATKTDSSRADVTQNIDKYFPVIGKYKQPQVRNEVGQMTLTLDPGDARYNAEIILIKFENDRVTSVMYMPD